MKNMLRILCVLVLSLGVVSTASAVSFTATVTADNHYAIYYSNGGALSFVGQNELGSSGSPGTYNWSQAETWQFDVNANEYIYVVGWSDDNVAQGWLGQFVSSGYTLLSNTADWEVLLTDNNLNDGSPAPTTTELGNEIYLASWGNVGFSIDHGSNPWGVIAGISPDADWIWGAPLTPGSGEGEYQIFRTKVAIPEPATMLLLGTGLLGLAAIGRRTYRKK